MSAIRINGIRVGHQMFHLRQYPEPMDSEPGSLLYQTLAGKGINLPCIGVERDGYGHVVSCCLEADYPSNTDPRPVCMVSVYPHGSRCRILGDLLSLFGRNGIDFFHMVSSAAMISFVIAQEDKSRVLTMLEQSFDLPPTHTPYEPGFHEETAAFVKKRYQETRAYFRETKIKTYGFALEEKMELNSVRCTRETLDQAGRGIGGGDTFYFTTALGHGSDITLHWLTRGDEPGSCFKRMEFIRDQVDFVSFHGPHFGDRFGIFDAAARCLTGAGLDFILAGCTGASISLVLPGDTGSQAINALEEGFEAP